MRSNPCGAAHDGRSIITLTGVCVRLMVILFYRLQALGNNSIKRPMMYLHIPMEVCRARTSLVNLL